MKSKFARLSRYVTLLSATIMALAPLAADASPGDASRARQAAIHAQMMQLYHTQLAATTAETAQQMWQSAANAPADFPLPVFNGTETHYMLSRMPHTIPNMQNVSQMILRTKDSPTTLNQWYQGVLTRQGLAIDNKGPQVTTVGYRVIRAESEKLSCNILIYGRESGDFDTTVNITAVRKSAMR